MKDTSKYGRTRFEILRETIEQERIEKALEAIEGKLNDNLPLTKSEKRELGL